MLDAIGKLRLPVLDLYGSRENGGNTETDGRTGEGQLANGRILREFGADLPGLSDEYIKLDLPVAQDIRIGRAIGTIFLQEIFEYPIPVLIGKVYTLQRDTQGVTHLAGIP